MDQDIKLEKMNKATIGDIIEENEVEATGDVFEEIEVEADNELITDAVIEPDLKETYVPNIKRDDNKKEDDIIED